MRVLWLTSCSRDLWQASGKTLIASFVRTRSEGDLFVAGEGLTKDDIPVAARVTLYDLAKNSWLVSWLAENAPYMPKALGGLMEEPLCTCPGGPFSPKPNLHRPRCPGSWWQKQASRWFRKIAALQHVRERFDLDKPTRKYDAVVWVDSDCVFRRRTVQANVAAWFGRTARASCFYVQSTRKAIEAGVVGYLFAGPGGNKLVENVVERYRSGRYRQSPRWDDSWQIQEALEETKVRKRDLAYAVGEHAGVVGTSLLGPYLAHEKGLHGRTLGIMR